jgi:hypothetical protein
MGPNARVDYNSPYLIVNSVVSYPTPTTKRRGWSGENLSYLLSTFVSVCYFPKLVFFMRTQVQRRGWEGVRSNLMSLNRHIMEH